MKDLFKKRSHFYLLAILIVSAVLNFYKLQDAGSNNYYTVAVKSMLTSFHTFFYASFDPVGYITVDKPPVALWVQAISAKIFGLSDFSVLLPEALAGVISVWLLYIIVARKFGERAGLIASLALALNPIFVAIVRTNNVDSILILTLLIATWSLMKAVEKQKLGWLLLSVALIGVGFNIKMLQAYMILPAIYLFYFIAAKTSLLKRIVHLVIATVILAGVSLSYPLAVQLIPEDERPYIGGSTTNSVLELAFGYNGIQRLTGQSTGGSGGAAPAGQESTQQTQSSDGTSTQTESNLSANTATGAESANANFPGGGEMPSGAEGKTGFGGQNSSGMFGTGSPSVYRLFGTELSGQTSWLLPFGLFAVIGVFLTYMKRREWTVQHSFTVFWVAWLAPMMVFFSMAEFFHQYYLSMLAPAIAALLGIGWTVLYDFYKSNEGWKSYLLPAAVLSTFSFEALVLHQNSDAVASIWVIVTFAAGIALTIIQILLKDRANIRYHLSIASILALLVAPTYWTIATINSGGENSSTPIAGPNGQSQGRGGMGGNMGDMARGEMAMGEMPAGTAEGQPPSGTMPTGEGATSGEMNASDKMGAGSDTQVNEKLLSYLEANSNGEKFILAVESAQSAYSIMLNTDYAVMAMGGFSGSDQVLDAEKLEEYTSNGTVKFFMIGGSMGGNSEASAWIQEHCEVVPTSEWQDSTSTSNTAGFGGRGSQNGTLYVYKG